MKRNTKISRIRPEWSKLDRAGRLSLYQQDLQAFKAALLPQHPGSYQAYATRQLGLDIFQNPAIAAPRQSALPMPVIFGTSERTLILATLWANGPMTVREIARLRGVDSASTYRSVERLLRSGLAVKRDQPGGRKYVSVNRGHVASHNLGILLDTLAKEYGVPVVDQITYRHGLPTRKHSPKTVVSEDWMFGSPVRSKILLVLAETNAADATQLSRVASAQPGSIRYAAIAMENAGITKSEIVGIRRIFRLASDYVGAKQFKAFLRVLARERRIYKSRAATIPSITKRWR